MTDSATPASRPDSYGDVTYAEGGINHDLTYTARPNPRLAQIQALLRDFKYKPGWTFYAEGGFGPPGVLFMVSCRDTYHPDRSFQVGMRRIVPDAADLREWLFEQIMEIEAHEAREWFQVSGKRPYDPHASVNYMGIEQTPPMTVAVQWMRPR